MVIKMFVHFDYVCHAKNQFRLANTNEVRKDDLHTIYWIPGGQKNYYLCRINERRMLKWEGR